MHPAMPLLAYLILLSLAQGIMHRRISMSSTVSPLPSHTRSLARQGICHSSCSRKIGLSTQLSSLGVDFLTTGLFGLLHDPDEDLRIRGLIWYLGSPSCF